MWRMLGIETPIFVATVVIAVGVDRPVANGDEADFIAKP
jgi:hypothetical protein